MGKHHNLINIKTSSSLKELTDRAKKTPGIRLNSKRKIKVKSNNSGGAKIIITGLLAPKCSRDSLRLSNREIKCSRNLKKLGFLKNAEVFIHQ